MSKANEQTLQNIYAAWRNKDYDGVMANLTDDCVYEDMAMGSVMTGKAEVRAFMEEVFQTMPDFHVVYTMLFATETRAAGQWVIKATWNGEFEGVDCTGKTVDYTGLSCYEFVDGKVSKTQDCWDFTQMMLDLGVLRTSLHHLRD